MWQNGKYHKALLLQTQAQWLSPGKAFVQLFELWAKLATFFMEHHFYLKEILTDIMVMQTWVSGRHFSQKWIKSVCHFKVNWQYLLLMIKLKLSGTSLVAQWLRICLPMQGTRIRALVWEDPTGCGATNPVHHNYWACALELVSHNYWACVPQLLKPARLEPVLHSKRSHHNKKPAHRNEE